MKAMKRILYLSFVSLQLALFTACGLSDIDNYEGPNATISGGLYDVETGELIQQDIIRGSQIEYIELGFKNPQTQYIVVKLTAFSWVYPLSTTASAKLSNTSA